MLRKSHMMFPAHPWSTNMKSSPLDCDSMLASDLNTSSYIDENGFDHAESLSSETVNHFDKEEIFPRQPDEPSFNKKTKVTKRKKKEKKSKSSKLKIVEHLNSNCEPPLPKLIIKNIKGPNPSVMFSHVTTKPASQTTTKKIKTEPTVTQSSSPLKMENSFSCESIFSAPTIADKVKLRVRGKSNVSAKDIYKSISEVDGLVINKTRKRRKTSTVKNSFCDNNNNFSSAQTGSSPTFCKSDSFSTLKSLQVVDIKTEAETSEIPSSQEIEVPSSSQESVSRYRLPSSSLNPDIGLNGPDIDALVSSISDWSENIDDTKQSLASYLGNGVLSANSSLSNEDPLQSANLPLMFGNVSELDIKPQVISSPNCGGNSLTDSSKVLYVDESFEVFDPAELVVASFEDAIEIPSTETLSIEQEPKEEMKIKEEPVDFFNIDSTKQGALPESLKQMYKSVLSRLSSFTVKQEPIDDTLHSEALLGKDYSLDIPLIRSLIEADTRKFFEADTENEEKRVERHLDAIEKHLLMSKSRHVYSDVEEVLSSLKKCHTIYGISATSPDVRSRHCSNSSIALSKCSNDSDVSLPYGISPEVLKSPEKISKNSLALPFTENREHSRSQKSTTTENVSSKIDNFYAKKRRRSPTGKPKELSSYKHKEPTKSKLLSGSSSHSKPYGPLYFHDYLQFKREDEQPAKVPKTSPRVISVKSPETSTPRTAHKEVDEEFSVSDRYRAMSERRVVYVGNIPKDYTVEQLKNRFNVFGPIIDIQIKFKDADPNDSYGSINSNAYLMQLWNENDILVGGKKRRIFGFITYKNQADATKAIERGNDNRWPNLTLNFGGRRHFVGEDYTDLDAKVAETETFLYNSHCDFNQNEDKENDYSRLLKRKQKRRGSSKTSTSKYS